MRVFDNLRRRPQQGKDAQWPTGEPAAAWTDSTGRAVRQAVLWALEQTPAQVWRNQPYVRTVVSFMARNIAQLGLHVFEFVSADDRRRMRDHPLAVLLKRPNDGMTGYELIQYLVMDLALYDRAYWLTGTGEPGKLLRIPPSRIVEHIAPDSLGQAKAYRYVGNGRTEPTQIDIPASAVLYFPGWNPLTPDGLPASPIDALKAIIAEQAAAFEFRKATWENGAAVTGSISRPADAPDWSDDARERFKADVHSHFGKGGDRRGGFILLEDGMALTSQQFNAREAEWIDAAKLSLALVASVYHVNPTMVGVLDNANYSNVKEFRKMLYGDTLGPALAQIESRLNAFLLPRFGDTPADTYVEFNLAEKMQGDFEETAAAMSTAVGAPWMTRAEARARFNLPPAADSDQLIVPLNVTTGGQPSPRTPVPASSAGIPSVDNPVSVGVSIKAAPATQVTDRATALVSEFFARQQRTVASRAGAGVGDVYQSTRWHKELGDVLVQVNLLASTDAGRRTLEQLGLDPDSFDTDRTLAWLTENANGVAGGINDTARSHVEKGIADNDLAHTYEVLTGAYATQVASTQVTAMTGWGSLEAARQQDTTATKMWVVTSTNPRASHAALNGQTVGLDDTFGNGARWPGDSELPDDERAGCTCVVEVNLPA